MPRHVVSYRPLEGEERDQLGAPRPTKTDEWGCAVAILAVAAALGCALGAALQMALQTLTHLRFLPLATTVLLVFVAWRVAGAVRRTQRETHTRLAQDRVEDAAEVIEVWDPVAVRQEHVDESVFFIDIGGGKVLVIIGHDLEEIPELRMGRPWPPREEPRSIVPWQPAFLNTHFVLHRGRFSGRILRVDALGDGIAVATVLPAGTVRIEDWRQSYVISAVFDTLTGATS